MTQRQTPALSISPDEFVTITLTKAEWFDIEYPLYKAGMGVRKDEDFLDREQATCAALLNLYREARKE